MNLLSQPAKWSLALLLTALAAIADAEPKGRAWRRFAEPSADGSHWLATFGKATPFQPLYLVEVATGRVTYAYPFAFFHPRTSTLTAEGRLIFRLPRPDFSGQDFLLADAGNPQPMRLPEESILFSGVDGRGERLVRGYPSREIAVFHLPDGRVLARAKLPPLPDHRIFYLIHRSGTLFDLAAMGLGREGWLFDRFRFDAATAELRWLDRWRLRTDLVASWSYPVENWWRQALPLLDHGVPLEELGRYRWIRALATGCFLAQDTDEAGYPVGRWTFRGPATACTGTLEVPAGGFLEGEIAPGVIAVGLPPPGGDDRLAGSQQAKGAAAYDDWTTLLYSIPGGPLPRRLPGFAPTGGFTGSGRTWLLGPWGEPYELADAQAEPRRVPLSQPTHSLRFLDLLAEDDRVAGAGGW